jgi:hypothetical protein
MLRSTVLRVMIARAPEHPQSIAAGRAPPEAREAEVGEVVQPWQGVKLAPNAMVEAVALPAALFGPFFRRRDEYRPR